MKNILSSIIGIICVLFATVPAFATDIVTNVDAVQYIITVDQETIDTNDLTYSTYTEGKTLMVPLRKISEALGYKVTWVPEVKEISVENKIQKAMLNIGSNIVDVKGKLIYIDLSREIELNSQIKTYQGHTYVPIDFFSNFFNDIDIDMDKMSIDISPQRAELS